MEAGGSYEIRTLGGELVIGDDRNSFMTTPDGIKTVVVERLHPIIKAGLDEINRSKQEKAVLTKKAELNPERFRVIVKCDGELDYVPIQLG